MRALRQPDAIAELQATVAALIVRVEAIERRRSNRGPRDAHDRALVWGIVRRLGDTAFTARWLMANRRRLELAPLTDVCDLDTPKSLGRWLRRMEGANVEGLEVRRVHQRRRAVTEWFVYLKNAPSSDGTMGP